MRKATGIFDSVIDAIGGTPVVALSRVFPPEEGRQVVAKLEFLNPSGSIKDRMVRYMLARSGARPGELHVESSSGNTGAALALACAVQGSDCELAVPEGISREKIDRLRAYGAVVHVCPGGEDGLGYRNLGRQLAEEKRGNYLDQYCSGLNTAAHYADTAPELWQQLEGRLDWFVCGMGSGGTIAGIGRYLKERDPRIGVIGVEPIGSVYHDALNDRGPGERRRSRIEGIGKPLVPESADLSVVDEVIQVTDEESIAYTRLLAQREGILAGGSSGAVAAAIARLLQRPLRGRIATVFPDSGAFYLSKYFATEAGTAVE